MMFNQMVSRKLGTYVYALADPRVTCNLKDGIFYVGKGKGNRCFNHAMILRDSDDKSLNEEAHKLGKIREIHQSGNDVEVLVVKHGMTDEQAFELEAVLIALLGDTNKVAGHGDQLLWLSRNQINQAYDRPVYRSDVNLLRGNVLFVSLNKQNVSKLLKPGNEQKLAEASLGDWNLNSRDSARVDCIVGVKNGLVTSIFETEKLDNGSARFDRIAGAEKGKHGRSRFYGVRKADLEERLRGRSVHSEGKMLSKIRPGAGCQFFPAIK